MPAIILLLIQLIPAVIQAVLAIIDLIKHMSTRSERRVARVALIKLARKHVRVTRGKKTRALKGSLLTADTTAVVAEFEALRQSLSKHVKSCGS